MLRMVSAAVLAALMAPPSFAVSGEALRKWQDDITFLRQELPKRHRDLYHSSSPHEFHRLLSAVEADLEKLTHEEIIVRLAQVVSQVADERDGHTGVALRPPSTSFRILPVNFFLYSDGLHVRGVTREHGELAGARVVSIGGTAAEEAVARVWTLARGDNDKSREADAAILLAIPEVLRALRIAPLDPAVPIEIVAEHPDGRRLTVPVAGLAKLEGVQWIDVRRQAMALPLYLLHADPNPFRWYAPSKALWFRHLPAHKALYVHYGAVADGPEETVAAFFARVFAFADANPVEKFVVDLRHNGGGNNFLNRPFLHGMIKRDQNIGSPRRFFVLIGRHTFSAAQNIVTQLEAQTSVMFAGEPTGGSPNHYGDATRLVLENSGLIIRTSTLWWQDAHPNDERLWIGPHIAAETASADDRAGRDPALEAVLAWKPEPSLGDALRTVLPRGKAEAAAFYQKWRSDPRRRYVDAERQVQALGRALFDEKLQDQALIAFEINAEAYPASWAAQESLGRAWQAVGKVSEAVAAYKRAAALSEKAVVARERLTQLAP